MNKHARPMVACTARTIITILLAVIVVSGRAQTSFDTGDGCLNVSLRNFSHKNLVSFVSIL